MPLTKSFRETVVNRAQSDPEFRLELLKGAVNLLLEGDIPTAKMKLRDYINATIGFSAVAVAVGKSSKSIQRMLGPSGNPGLNSIIPILKTLQDNEGIRLNVN